MFKSTENETIQRKLITFLNFLAFEDFLKLKKSLWKQMMRVIRLFLTDKSNTEFLFGCSLKEKTAPQSSKIVLLVTLVLCMIILS